jgi:mono/diheme cytochrome c family protein
MPNAFPPLENSPFVNGDKATLIKLVLNGMIGPLTVNGARFNGVMPPWKGQLNDADVAAVLTYVRSNFTNTSGPVSAEEVATQRAATASRNTPFTASELGH